MARPFNLYVGIRYVIVSSAPGTALRIVLLTRFSTACTTSGCDAMYSSTDLLSFLAIRISSLPRRPARLGIERAPDDRLLSHTAAQYNERHPMSVKRRSTNPAVTVNVGRLSPQDCLAGGGDMGALMRSTDWSQTVFGPVADWPQSLRTAISIMLESRFAMVVAWGPDFRFFYNDRYRPILGTKHPAALGAPGVEIFPEVW